MCVPSIQCGMPFCRGAEEAQTPCFLYARISFVAIGGIMLLVSILSLSGIPGLQTLGTLGGATLTAIGGLSVFAGLCLRSVKGTKTENTQQTTDDKKIFIDPRTAGNFIEKGSCKDKKTQENTSYTLTYFSLEKFLASSKPNDIAVRDRLTKELNIVDLSQRMEENFPNSKVNIALPLYVVNDIRDDELIFQILKLTYLSERDLLDLSLDEIKDYDEEKRNILCLRLMHINKPICRWNVHTLAALRFYENEIFNEELSRSLYAFFTKEQVDHFLTLTENEKIDQQLIKALFPFPRHFMAMRSASIYAELNSVLKARVQPFLNGKILWNLIEAKIELNYDLITENQIKEMIPSNFTKKMESEKRMCQLSIDALNKILPKMDPEQLRLIPDIHLSNPHLKLATLSNKKISDMFSTDVLKRDKSRSMLNKLHIDNRQHVKTIVKL